MKLSYDATWQDITSLLRAHGDMILILAGVFFLLPPLAQALYFPQPNIARFDMAAMQSLLSYFEDNFAAVFAMRLMSLLGTGALLALLISTDRPTVGEAIKRGGKLLPSLFLVDVLVQILSGLGLIALVVPGLYLLARTSLSQAAMMAEAISNPLRAIGRSFALTDKMGWRVFGFIAIVMVVTWIVTSAGVTVLGVIGQVALPDSATQLTRAILAALSTAIFTLAFLLVSAGLYRQLSARNSGM